VYTGHEPVDISNGVVDGTIEQNPCPVDGLASAAYSCRPCFRPAHAIVSGPDSV